MIHLIGKIPQRVGVAVSGGVDSMAVLHFLTQRNRQVTAFFFDHGTKTSWEAKKILDEYCKKINIDCIFGKITRDKKPDESQEEYWRKERYTFLNMHNDELIITCHHLQDVVETWIFSSLHGEGKIIPYKNKNIIRPFLLNKKETFYDWCTRHDVPWIEDQSNYDNKYKRNFIRNVLLPQALDVNPGLFKVVKKKIIKLYKEGSLC
jgi:tRNA(Ile)-lysidine synthase